MTAACGRADLRSYLTQETVMAHALEHHEDASDTPHVRHVPTLQAFEWLRRGYADLKISGWPSLAYGALIAGLGVVLLSVTWAATYLVPAIIGGFLLVAPFVAIGLYAMSAQIERDEQVDVAQAMLAWRPKASSATLFGLVLALTLILWERIAAITFRLSYGGEVPDLMAVIENVLSSGEYWPLLLAFFVAGAAFAAMAFSLSVVSGPLLLDRRVDAMTAIVTSMRCCLENPLALLLWAALIAGLVLVGFATFTPGLIVIFPWLAHASWHAYRDLVE
jgi:uncharacterized membrane protein